MNKNNDYLKKLALKWIKQADDDFEYAQTGFKETDNHAMTCFICHQVAEKYLKSYLMYNSTDINEIKIHDLMRLLKHCKDINKDFFEVKESLEFLNRYYIDTRYPVFWGQIYKAEDSEKAIEHTQKVINFVKARLR